MFTVITQSKEAVLAQAVNRVIMFKWLKKHAMRLPAGDHPLIHLTYWGL